MPQFRVYYRDNRGKIFSSLDLVAVDDRDAIARAMALVADHAPNLEVWQDTRLVHRGSMPDPSAEGGTRKAAVC